MQFHSLKGYTLVAVAMAASSLPASAASFEFSTLIRLGGNGGGANWEIGAGGSSITENQNAANWSSGNARGFQITYSRPSNSLEVRLFENGSHTGNSAAVTYNPVGGPLAINATWTLPASAFFVSAGNAGDTTTLTTVSNMTLTGLSGGLTILSPMQQTSLQAQSGFNLPAATVRESSDIVFRGDANGSWRLAGFITMNFPTPSPGSARDLLQFGVGGSAADVTATPEPSTWALFLTGFAVVAISQRYRRSCGTMPRAGE